MANILYITRNDFIYSERSGGMGTKTRAIEQAWSDDGINKITCSSTLHPLSDESEEQFDVVIIELLGIAHPDKFETFFETIKDYDGVVLVYGSDSELLRWKGCQIKALNEVAYGWIANCKWQANYFRDFQLPVLGVVREPIDCDLFRPNEQKTMSIVAGGTISHGKQSDFFIDLFQAIGEMETPYTTGYIGSADGWGGKPDFRALKLESDLETVTNNFYGQVPPSRVASLLSMSAIVVVNSHYETCNRFGMEAMATGSCIVGGSHLCFDEWPHAQRFSTLEECMELLSKLTDEFTRLPDRQIGEKTTRWAKENFSYESSLKQFNAILRRTL